MFTVNDCIVRCGSGFSGLYDADYVVMLDWFRIDTRDLIALPLVAHDMGGKINYSSACYLQKPMLIGIGQVADYRQQRRQLGMLTPEGLEQFHKSDISRSETIQSARSSLRKLGGVGF